MDPISHALIGAGVAALSGQPFAWDNPIYIGSILGSMAPDLDIIMQTKGHLTYLKHHRGISHSLPVLTGIALVISGVLYFAFPGVHFWSLFGWTLAGTLSHGIFDLLNSYGARLLWPFVKRRLTINSIIVSDPIILGSFIFTFWHNIYNQNFSGWAFAVSAVYVFLRWRGKCDVLNMVQQQLGGERNEIMVFPAMYRLFSWNFVLERENDVVIGSVPFGKPTIVVKEILDKRQHPAIDTAEDSELGEVFRDFTPHYHVSHQWLNDCQIVQFKDLRYHAKRGFMHTGTAILDQEGVLLEQTFEPYNAKKSIKIA
ncbi:MAG: metal-dependent hydrolase [Peptococcaceae bacterium]|nr:metal-dependent hydrolase [Peptococcaceae bacterium]